MVYLFTFTTRRRLLSLLEWILNILQFVVLVARPRWWRRVSVQQRNRAFRQQPDLGCGADVSRYPTLGGT